MGKGNGANGGGGRGDDVLHDGGGQTVLRGGRGDDSYYIDTDGVVVDEKNNGGEDTVFSWVDYNLDEHVENVTLMGDLDLSGAGNDLDNTVVGNDGANQLSGGGGNDQLFGGLGDDRIDGGVGMDTIDGGDGSDTAVFAGPASDYSYEWIDDALLVTSAEGETNTLRNVEFLAFDDQTIEVAGLVETPPPDVVAINDTATGDEDVALVINVLGNDAGEGLAIQSVTNGSMGSATVNADNTLTYAPDPDAYGTDTITYTIVDQFGGTSTASVDIVIEPVNDAPLAEADVFVAISGETLLSSASVLANDTDADGDGLAVSTYDAVTENGGTVAMSPDGTFSYTSPDGFTGVDSFAYTASDGNGGAQSVTVQIDVAAPTLPIASGDAVSTQEDQSIIIDVLANDAGTGLTILSVAGGSLGTVSVNADNTLTYTPDPNAHGEDAFSYTVVDTVGQQTTTAVSVTINPENDNPVAVDDFYIISSGGAFESADSLLDNDADVDGDPLSVTSFDATSENGGAISVNPDGTFSYQNAEGFSGTDRFAYTVGDGQGGEHTAYAEFQVEDVTDPTPPPDPEPTANFIDELMAGDWYRLNANEDYGSAATVTFAFASSTPGYYSDSSAMRNNFQEFSETQKSNTLAALSDIASFTNLTFVETAVEDAEMVFGIADVGSAGFAYWPTFNGVGKTASDVWIDDGLAASGFEPGTAAYTTLVHEIGHALGLTHPELATHEENHAFTVMADSLHPDMEGAEATTFMLYDVATLQYLYGSNDQHANGDDVYTFEDVRDDVLTLWDAGGHDTLDLSAASYGVSIDLNAGAHSTVAQSGEGNLAIAIGAEIEDAVGSSFDDHLVGNELNNQLTGGEGADTFGFADGWGQDTVTDFVKGEDILQFKNADFEFEDIQTSLSEEGLLITAGAGTIFLVDYEEELDELEMFFSSE